MEDQMDHMALVTRDTLQTHHFFNAHSIPRKPVARVNQYDQRSSCGSNSVDNHATARTLASAPIVPNLQVSGNLPRESRSSAGPTRSDIYRRQRPLLTWWRNSGTKEREPPRDIDLDPFLITGPQADETSHCKEFKSSAEPSQTRQRTPLLRALLWEILSLVLAATSLVAFCVILRKYEDKETPTWSLDVFGVTLNALLSILSTAFRASLMVPVAQSISQFCWIWYTRPRPLQDICYYDSASRGPWGCFLLLLRLRFIRFACIGAIITLCALVVDPFFQQSVRYVLKSAVDNSSQAQSVAAYTYHPDSVPAGEFNSLYQALPYDMKAAVYSGVLSSNLISLPPPPFNCPSGNCTWDPYATLSVGVQCTDITSYVRVNCTGENCRFVSFDDPSLQSLLATSDDWSTFIMDASLAREALAVLKSYANMIGFMSMVQWVKALNVQQGEPLTSNTTYEAARCGFYMSVKEVSARVSNGVYTERVLQEYTQAENKSSETTQGPTYVLNGTDFWMLDPFGSGYDLIYTPPFAKSPPNLNNTFVVPYTTFSMLQSQLVDFGFLNGNVTTGESNGISGPDIITMLYQADNVTLAMYNLAEYMTTLIRGIGSTNLQKEHGNTSLIAPSQAVPGVVWVQRQFVTVRWAWLVLPVVMLVLAILFLFAAYLETRTNGIELWQSSPLALFFHSRLSDDTAQHVHQKSTSLSTEDEMQEAAKKFCAIISKDARGAIEVYSKTDTLPGL